MLKPRQGQHDYEFDILKNINEYKEAYPNSSKFLRIELTKMRTERQRNHHNDRMMVNYASRFHFEAFNMSQGMHFEFQINGISFIKTIWAPCDFFA